MDNKQNQGGKELAERIQAVRGEPVHRFEVYDHNFEVTYRFPKASEAAAKADELGSTRFQHLDADRTVKQVDKVDGQWYVRNEPTPFGQGNQQPPAAADKPLASVQAEIDQDALRAIEIRAEQRAAVGQGLDADTDRQMATADAFAFRRIEDKDLQESAAVEMANNAREYPNYKEGLEKAIPGYPGTAEKVYALDAANEEKIAAKDERKQAEYDAAKEEQRERAAAWTPEEAAHQAKQDAAALREEKNESERFYKASDMTANADANPDYREAMNREAPEVSKDVAVESESNSTATVTPIKQEEQVQAITPEPMTLTQADLDRVAASRLRDFTQARESLGLNSVEPYIEKEQQQLSEAQDAQRAAWLKKAEADAPNPQPGKAPGDNNLESDEIFTATQTEVKPAVPPDIEKQYLHVGNKFYHPKNTDMVAFEDKGNKLETKSNSEAIAESMVRIAEARGWDEIKVSGSETFRKEVWLEAAARGMQVKGYTPSEQDKAELAKRTSQAEANKIEKGTTQFRARETDEAKESKVQQPEQAKPDSKNKQMAESFAKDSPEEATKKHPELAAAAAAVASMEKKAEADGLNAEQRAIVMARVRQNVVNSIERGEIPDVKVKEEIEVKREATTEKEHER